MGHVPSDRSLADWLSELYPQRKEYMFYKSKEWETLREDVLRESNWECQFCLDRGVYTPAEHVHHVNEVRVRPDLALSAWYIDASGIRRRNLVALCHQCHDEAHGRCKKKRGTPLEQKPVTIERW